jgi:hypothetical protein
LKGEIATLKIKVEESWVEKDLLFQKYKYFILALHGSTKKRKFQDYEKLLSRNVANHETSPEISKDARSAY